MSELELSQVQAANLNMLIMMAEQVKQDRTIACSRFGLDSEQADFIATLTFPSMVAVVTHLGDECLFPPRSDLVQILTWPSQIASTLLLARPHQSKPPPHLARTIESMRVEMSGKPRTMDGAAS